MSGVIKFAGVLQDSGSLSKLDISGNRICGLDERGNGTYDASGLAALTNSIGNLKELNISNNSLKAEGAKVLVPALEANGPLVSLDISDNNIGNEQEAKIKQICAGKSIKFRLTPSYQQSEPEIPAIRQQWYQQSLHRAPALGRTQTAHMRSHYYDSAQ
jgi:hypothetical protein